MEERTWFVYLSGEIHSDWRERIARGVADASLPVRIDAPVCVHEDSDDCGTTILGSEPDAFWHDRKGATTTTPSARTRRSKETRPQRRAERLSDLMAPRTARVPTLRQCVMQNQDSPYE
jgi:hypothetical protein